jgi:streptogramin lyase
MIRLVTLLSLALGFAAGPPPAPTVVGARSTTDTTPTFTFKSKGARSFECAVDAAALKKCAARFTSARLAVGAHKLRVRAVNAKKQKSRITTVAFKITAAVPPPPPPPPAGPLRVAATAPVDAWPGNPVVAFGSLWVPSSKTGSVERLNATTGAPIVDIKAINVGVPEPGTYFDTLAASSNAIWYASDAGSAVAHIDPANNTVVATVTISNRISGIAVGAGSVWVSTFDGANVIRIDPASNEISGRVNTGETYGIAFAGGSVWALSGSGPTLFRIDPASNQIVQTISVKSTAPELGGNYQAWQVAGGASGVWVLNQLQNVVTHLDTTGKILAQIALGTGFQPWSVALDGTSAWVVNMANVFRIDAGTNAVVSTTAIPTGTGSGFFGIAALGSQIWATNYDKNEAYLIGP